MYSRPQPTGKRVKSTLLAVPLTGTSLGLNLRFLWSLSSLITAMEILLENIYLPGLWGKVFLLVNCGRAACLLRPHGGAFAPATHFRARVRLPRGEERSSWRSTGRQAAGGSARTGWPQL